MGLDVDYYDGQEPKSQIRDYSGAAGLLSSNFDAEIRCSLMDDDGTELASETIHPPVYEDERTYVVDFSVGFKTRNVYGMADRIGVFVPADDTIPVITEPLNQTYDLSVIDGMNVEFEFELS